MCVSFYTAKKKNHSLIPCNDPVCLPVIKGPYVAAITLLVLQRLESVYDLQSLPKVVEMMAAEQPGEVSVCDPTNRRHARREQRPDTEHPRFRVIAANKCEAALAPSRAAAFGKIVYGHRYFFVFPEHVLFSTTANSGR